MPIVNIFTRNTRPTNFLGLPALVVPTGFSGDGLPIALQLIGRPFSEALLFSVDEAYQSATSWQETAPEI